ncbi:MAG: DivIVA domain-containing protein [Erysipelotrichaceae bacterium]|nr:DivIVA domain-containing protein [Erysipelotrichaceae bacterium]
MDNVITLTVDEILSKEFSVDFKGYTPIEVDQFLDIVMADYKTYETKVASLEEKIVELEKYCAELKTKLVETEGQNMSRAANNAMAQQQTSQVDILKRLSRLEQAVFNSGRQF